MKFSMRHALVITVLVVIICISVLDMFRKSAEEKQPKQPKQIFPTCELIGYTHKGEDKRKIFVLPFSENGQVTLPIKTIPVLREIQVVCREVKP